MTNYEKLEAQHVIDTVERLHRRINDRFPDSGLSKVCLRLLMLAREAGERSHEIGRPIRALRAATWIMVVFIVIAVIAMGVSLRMPEGTPDFLEFVQIFEAGINDVVLIGAGIFFLASFERRLKRNRALRHIGALRAIAHIVDMHQLTKDPSRVSSDWHQSDASPVNRFTPFLLTRYLDYCSELLSLTGKIAALYVQYFDDEVVTSAVNEVEQLTTGLSRKIWQKIMIMRNQKEG